jgi:hypothetical protein
MTPFITGFMDNKTEAFWDQPTCCKPDGAMLLSMSRRARSTRSPYAK